MQANGHDNRGRFAPGNPGGPGRPRRTIEFDYLRIMAEVVTPDDWREIVKKALDSARYGDERAREWLAKYLIGASVMVKVAPSALPDANDRILDASEEALDGPYLEPGRPAEPPRVTATARFPSQ